MNAHISKPHFPTGLLTATLLAVAATVSAADKPALQDAYGNFGLSTKVFIVWHSQTPSWVNQKCL